MLNEEKNVGRLLTSIWQQRVLPSEVIFIDAESRDRTVDVINELAGSMLDLTVRVFTEPGTIGHCRNFGISRARYEFILSTDADCELDVGFVDAMCDALERHDVVGGKYDVEPQTFAERLFQATRSISWERVDDLYVYPSMAIGFRKSAFDAVGGYNEILEASEDLELCLRLRRMKGLSFCLCRDAKVTHYPGRGFWVLLRGAYRDIERNVSFGLAGRRTPHWKILLASALFLVSALALLTGASWVFLGLVLVIAGYAVIVYSRISREIRGRGFGVLVVLVDLLTRLVQGVAVYTGLAEWVMLKMAPDRRRPRRKLG